MYILPKILIIARSKRFKLKKLKKDGS